MTIRKARMADMKQAHKLLMACAQKGQLLARPLSGLFANLRDFVVAEAEDGVVVGCSALSICWDDLAEVRSLAVDESMRGKGLGRSLVVITSYSIHYTKLYEEGLFGVLLAVVGEQRNNFV